MSSILLQAAGTCTNCDATRLHPNWVRSALTEGTGLDCVVEPKAGRERAVVNADLAGCIVRG
jgi:hypothetical protein